MLTIIKLLSEWFELQTPCKGTWAVKIAYSEKGMAIHIYVICKTMKEKRKLNEKRKLGMFCVEVTIANVCGPIETLPFSIENEPEVPCGTPMMENALFWGKKYLIITGFLVLNWDLLKRMWRKKINNWCECPVYG